MPKAAAPITPQAPTSREIRVFLSSTFQDMDAERNHLLKQVFPQVRAACLARQVGFTEIDLRWGVTEEESKNGATVEICLKEIDRCRDFPPFFIGFLGERYGWIPRHDDLTAYWARHAESPYAKTIQDAAGLENCLTELDHEDRAGSPYVKPIRGAVDRGISVTELEMELAVLATGATDKLAGHALFLLRDPALTDRLYQQATGRAPDPSDRRFYDPADGQLHTLKDRIRHSGFLGVDGYPSVEVFGQTIADYLLAQLDHYFPADEIPSAFAQSNLAHATFRYHRLKNFLPRPEVRQAVVAALAQRADQPHLGTILLTGPSGQGKSALMADLAQHLATQPGYRVIDHYIGADAHISLEAWVLRVLQSLHPFISDLSGDIPDSPKEQAKSLSTWLDYAATRQQCRYVLLLDALDQLSDSGKDLSLLTPEIIGPSATVIASVADGTPGREAARSFEAIAVPALTAELRAHLIRDTLARFRKGLASQLVDTLAQAPQSGSPLFLTLALEELRLDARHATLASTLDDILAQPDAERLFLHAFLLDPDNNRPEQPDLAVRFMALLGASRAGLTEHELADLLALPSDPELKGPLDAGDGQPRLPQVHLSRLLTNFQPFLLNKDGRRAPMHRIFGVAALAHAGEAGIREQLYAYFQPGYGTDWDSVEERGAAEALYQITQLATLEGEDKPIRRKRLVRNLGSLRVPALLCKVAKVVTAEALMALTEEEKTALGNIWQQVIGDSDLAGVNKASADILVLADLMKDLAFDRYRLPRRLIEALLAVQKRLMPVDDLKLANTMNSLGGLCTAMADYLPVRPLYERALAIREQVLGPMHPGTSESLSSLAVYLTETGDPADRAAARPLFERALEIDEKTSGPTHPDTAWSLDNLAGYLIRIGNAAERAAARPLYERALEIREQALGPTHPDTARSLEVLASYLGDSGDPVDFAAARPLIERALAIREQVQGPIHPDTASSLNDLAIYLEKTGDPADRAAVRPLLERTIAIYEQALGPTHVHTSFAINNLAVYIDKTGDIDDRAASRSLYERSLSIREQALGPKHPHVAESLSNLASKLAESSNPADKRAARPLLERALAIREQVLGPIHPDTARSLNKLAGYLAETGDSADYAAARHCYERALAIREATLGTTHPETAWSLNNLAVYLSKTGDPTDRAAVRPLLERTLAIIEQALGPTHPDTASCLNNLANYLQKSGNPDDFAAARPLFERALAIREEALGPTHTDTASCLNNLANYLQQSGDPVNLAAVRPLLERTLAIIEQALGPTHPDTASCLNDLANYLQKSGDPDDFDAARPFFERALAIREETLGQMHPDTASSLNNLAAYLDETGDPTDFMAARALYERALAITEHALGPTHPDTAMFLNNLAFYLKKTGDPADFAAAHPLFERALAIREQILGLTHPDTLRSLNNLARYLDASSDPADQAQARSLRQRAKAILSPTNTQETLNMRLTETLQQWLQAQEWEEQPEIDEENQTSSTRFGFTVSDINLDGYFDISEQGQLFKIYMYSKEVKVPEKRLDEIQKFTCEYSKFCFVGQLQLLREQRMLRYYNAIDVEDAAFEPQHITNMLNAAINIMGTALPKYMAICFGGKSAEEALAEE